jgi:hypothetical protein
MVSKKSPSIHKDIKASKQNVSDFIKKKPGIALAIAYLCSGVIFAGSIYYLYQKNGSVDVDIVNKTVNNFFLSFSASLLEDLVFFFFIGIVLFIITLKKMEDNEIDVRLDTVINSPNVTASAREYFRNETKSVLAFYERCDVLIKITQYDKKVGAYKLYLSFNAIINNMCKDIQFNVQTNAFVKPGVEVNNNWGELTIFNIKDIASGSNAGEPIGIPVQLDEKGYNKTIPLLISDSGKAEYQLGFGIWSKYDQVEDLFLTSVDRFTDSYNLTIENGLEDEISFKFSAKLESQDELYQPEVREFQPLTKLEPHSQFQLMKGNNLKPKEIVKIFLGKPHVSETTLKGDCKDE